MADLIIEYNGTVLIESDVNGLKSLETELGLGPIPKIEDIYELIRPFGFLVSNQRITALALEGKKIKKISKSITIFKFLEMLDLSNNQLTLLPNEIVNLGSLKELILDGNRMTSIPLLPTLNRLYVSMNKLRSIPDTVWKLQNLQYLDFSDNRISNVPEEIDRLTNLKDLNLAGNQLKMLPSSIGSLMHLECLILDNNKLESLPETINQLKSLKRLIIVGNPLRKMTEAANVGLNRLKEQGCKIIQSE
jgi:Leucine-rich repeat (LRR) protein